MCSREPASGGSIGAYAAAFARGLGAAEVVYISPDEQLCAMAEMYGATARRLDGERPEFGVFDVTVDASGDAGTLAFTLGSTGPNGVCTSIAGAVHRGGEVPLPVYEMYMNSVTFHTGWVPARALLGEPLRHMTGALFDPCRLASVVDFEDAESAFAEPFTKLILTRSASRRRRRVP